MLLGQTISRANSLHFLMTVQKVYSFFFFFFHGVTPGNWNFISQGINGIQPNLKQIPHQFFSACFVTPESDRFKGLKKTASVGPHRADDKLK